jgi:hypothetical protein
MTARLDRRTLLVGSAAAAAGLVGAAVLWRRSEPEAPTDDAHVVDEPDDAALVAQVGQAYRQAVPAEDDLAVLRGLVPQVTGTTPDEALAGFEALDPGADLAEGRTVVVEGWVLSVTEARAAARISLL